MASSRLHEVLTIGMHAGTKRGHDGASRGTLSDENDPIFLVMVKEAIHHELVNLVDPPDPSAAYNEQQEFRASRFDAGFYMYSEEESIPRPAPEVVSTYETTIQTTVLHILLKFADVCDLLEYQTFYFSIVIKN